MSNLLYTITAYTNDITSFSPRSEGIGCTTQYDISANTNQYD